MRVPLRRSGLLFVFLLAAGFVRLGLWQLDRLADRREANARRAAALALPPLEVDLHRIPPPSGADVFWRRVRVRGAWDPGREIVVRGRSHLGSPGIELLTPLRADSSAVLVRRGWLPAADGVAADLAGARIDPRAGTVVVEGIALPGEPPGPVPSRRLRFATGPRVVLGAADLDAAADGLPYPLAPFIIHPLPGGSDSAGREAGAPVPLPVPELTDGPHLLYAMQWFGFAALALGAALLLPRAAAGRRAPPLEEP
ncbi:MAG: SURF1 family protein [Gemmatimonadota bacterium]|nr:SURF1 family protein [Gemmatimonadota bacterium]